ncbi:hypothetical protein H5410_015647 [Solanum commersonii]|uniref:Uncharacterized protein n=1 Tax=Solanum commersonii TaxID=4109 RepID=A0A9J5ZV55_SOLCO|nr:hypothetical protein H5410_015647 [Solanum commersonii]
MEYVSVGELSSLNKTKYCTLLLTLYILLFHTILLPLMILACIFQPQFPAMTERLNINKIDMSIEEWTCKVQVVDKGHPRTNKEGNKKY